MFIISAMVNIAEQIIKIRKESGLSQKELGALIGKTAGAICNYEKSRRPIRANDLEKIKEHCHRRRSYAEGTAFP